VWIDLIGGLFLPVGIAGIDGSLADWALGLLCWAAKLIVAVVCLAAVRALVGWSGRRAMPNLAAIAVLLALLATIVVLTSAGTA
jgi:hypothetical protein